MKIVYTIRIRNWHIEQIVIPSIVVRNALRSISSATRKSMGSAWNTIYRWDETVKWFFCQIRNHQHLKSSMRETKRKNEGAHPSEGLTIIWKAARFSSQIRKHSWIMTWHQKSANFTNLVEQWAPFGFFWLFKLHYWCMVSFHAESYIFT